MTLKIPKKNDLEEEILLAGCFIDVIYVRRKAFYLYLYYIIYLIYNYIILFYLFIYYIIYIIIFYT